MLILRIALRNLLRHPIKTFLIGSLIALSICFLFCTNAIFENTSRGLKTSFIGSLTGNFAISAWSEEPFGIFGSEVPIVSEYQRIPPIADFMTLSDVLNSEQACEVWTPLVSVIAQVNIGGYTVKCPVFGVDASTYFSVCSDIIEEWGEKEALTKGGIFLNSELAAGAEGYIGRPLIIGEPIVFSMYMNGSFRARRGIYSGVYRYPAPTEAMKRIVLADPVIVRALCDYTMGYSMMNQQETGTNSNEPILDLDGLFSEEKDIVVAPTTEFSLTDLEATLADTAGREALVATDAAAWSFVLVRIKPDNDTDAVRWDVVKELRRRQVNVRVMDWRNTVGSGALMLFAIRIAFNIGMGVLILGAVLIVMNALVISVLERTDEIGTMRALGASRGFIRSLFILETMIQTMVSAAIGVGVGSIITIILTQRGIPIINPLLITLFGGNSIKPMIEIRAIFIHFIGAVFVASFAWIYPVSIALKIQPVSAMAEQ